MLYFKKIIIIIIVSKQKIEKIQMLQLKINLRVKYQKKWCFQVCYFPLKKKNYNQNIILKIQMKYSHNGKILLIN